jgi:hypothetical protein
MFTFTLLNTEDNSPNKNYFERQSPPTADQKTGQLGSGGTPSDYTPLRQTQGAVSG